MLGSTLPGTWYHSPPIEFVDHFCLIHMDAEFTDVPSSYAVFLHTTSNIVSCTVVVHMYQDTTGTGTGMTTLHDKSVLPVGLVVWKTSGKSDN